MITDAQLDALKQELDSRVWEALNAEDPKAQKALDLLNKAAKALDGVVDMLIEAAAQVDNTPHGCRITSLKDGVEEMGIAVQAQATLMERG